MILVNCPPAVCYQPCKEGFTSSPRHCQGECVSTSSRLRIKVNVTKKCLRPCAGEFAISPRPYRVREKKQNQRFGPARNGPNERRPEGPLCAQSAGLRTSTGRRRSGEEV